MELIKWLMRNFPIKISRRRFRPAHLVDNNRFSYQQRFNQFEIEPGFVVLDIGSGGYPFPYATIIGDYFLEITRHRSEELVRDSRPIVLFDVQNMPFVNKSVDFVYCSHVLEHIDNPLKACKEIIRVGKRGYIETPALGKDALFAWAKGRHKWHLVAIGQTLCFFEYSERQLEGIKSSIWRDIIFSNWYHPLQKAFYQNQDLFNIMFTWSGSFSVFVFRLDGTVEILNT